MPIVEHDVSILIVHTIFDPHQNLMCLAKCSACSAQVVAAGACASTVQANTADFFVKAVTLQPDNPPWS